MARKRKKKEKDDRNHSLQRQVSHSASFDFWSFQLEYLELEKSI
jgi:hypothetical protein